MRVGGQVGWQMIEPEPGDVANAEGARARGDEYVAALGKVIASHVRNEIAGARVFDEPAIALAPGPREKWLACRIAMEEYGHHLRFSRLATDLRIQDTAGGTLSVFEYKLSSWVEFVVLKAIVDLAEVLVLEDLAGCSYLPLRRLATAVLPEERFHVSFGQVRTKALSQSSSTRPGVQQAVNQMVAMTLPFFGRSVSSNNDTYRRFGIKRRTNDETRAEFVRRSERFVVGLGLGFPEVSLRCP
jgi:ring-1,2-phenylacetyl-CoA epoxidase subunit PaaA